MAAPGLDPIDACESFTGDVCDLSEIDLPEWITVDETTVQIGTLVGLVYLDADGELYQHEFSPTAAPSLFGGDGALIAIGPTLTLTDLGIED